MNTNLSNSLFRLLADLLAPASELLIDDQLMATLVQDLGVVEHDPAALESLLTSVEAIRQEIEGVQAAGDVTLTTVTHVLGLARQAMALLRGADAAGGAFASVPGLGRDLVIWIAGLWLSRYHPAARQMAGLLTLLDLQELREPDPARVVDGVLVRLPVHLDRFRFDRLGELLRNPVTLLKDEYVNALSDDAQAAEMARRLFPRLVDLARTLDLAATHGIHEADAADFGDAAVFMRNAMVVYATDPLASDGTGAGFALAFAPATRGDLGLVVSPFGSLSREGYAGAWQVRLEAQAALSAFAWGRHGATLLPLADDGTGAPSVSLSLETTQPDPPWIFGDADGTRLELNGLRLRGELALSEGEQRAAIVAEADSALMVIAPAGADGFVSSLLPKDGLRAQFGLGLGWSSEAGVTLRGHGSLEATLPVNKSIGGVSLEEVHVGLRAVQSTLDLELSASLSASLGPVRATVRGVGLEVKLNGSHPEPNLGVADLQIGFKRPHGVGLAIDTQGLLIGGGFLAYDAATDGYAGALQVSLRSGLTLSAYGLIATRLPSGRRGYSLLVFITADGFKPIPLGLGFSLHAIGGMLGLHRTFDVAALRTTLREGRLGQLLLPSGPLANAPDLLRSLNTVFPVREGSYLLSLAVRITWFEPVLVRMDLSLTLELGIARRLLAMGRVSALLPSAENDLIRLNLDALGVLDFSQGTLEADALLTDSRLAHRFPVTGSAALRTRWTERRDEQGASQSTFALSAGGFNPRYSPPVGFPALERVTIALTRGKSPRIVCEAYFAITANTVQFGAQASLYAEALGFSIMGELGFDALISLAPPRFVIDFRAQVQLRRGSRNLFKVQLRGMLEGPLPLRLQAKASFEILWVDFTVRFDLRLADGDAGSLPAPVRLEQELRQLLASPASWRAAATALAPHGVQLRAVAAADQTLVLDPLGRLVLEQQLVPLNTDVDVDTFGGVRVEGRRRFHVAASLGGQAGTPIRAAFAPARYFEMTDDEKLTAPAFRAFDSGVVLGDEAASFSVAHAIKVPLAYRQLIIVDDAPAGASSAAAAHPAPVSAQTGYTLSADHVGTHLRIGPAALAPIRRIGAARFRNRDVEPAVTVRAPS
jgi:hypothetical protein